MDVESINDIADKIIDIEPTLEYVRSYLLRDIYEQIILKRFYESDVFKMNFAFKGGSAISKCVLNYHRFSADLDFTYIHSYNEIEGKYNTEKKKLTAYNNVRKLVTPIIEKTAIDLKDAGVIFVNDPSKIEWVHFKFGGRVVTYKYRIQHPEFQTERDMQLRIEINFAERVYYPITRALANTYANIHVSEYTPVMVSLYDPHELLIEKYKTMLGRIMVRDYYDAYFLHRIYYIDPLQVSNQILEKLLYSPMLHTEKIQKRTQDTLIKYLSNTVTPGEVMARINNIKPILLWGIPSSFEKFVERTVEQMMEIASQAYKEIYGEEISVEDNENEMEM